MCTVGADAADGKEALCLVRPLIVEDGASLVQVRLLTGRTHQIRTQLASLGHPVLGDAKYGQARPGSPLYLHALRMILPEGAAFASLPPWVGARAVTDLPDPIACGDGLPLRHPSCVGYSHWAAKVLQFLFYIRTRTGGAFKKRPAHCTRPCFQAATRL